MASKHIHQMTLTEWKKAFPTEEACQNYLVAHRWPTGVRCPRCDDPSVKPHGTIAFAWLCNNCSPTNYRFSVIAGTVFENTNKPLRDWFRVIHLMLTSKKPVSALQIHRIMGFGSYKTAWYMCRRVRNGLDGQEFRKLIGFVGPDAHYDLNKVRACRRNKSEQKRGEAIASVSARISASSAERPDATRILETATAAATVSPARRR